MRSIVLGFVLLPALAHAGSDYVRIPAGEFASALKYEDIKGDTRVGAFELMQTPVTNAQFLDFVRSHPEWQRDRVAPVYAEKDNYLSHWSAPLLLGDAARARQPVTHVSWFAATAYCEAQQARLPLWAEWEYVSAADATRHDARGDPAWRESILGWYSKPSTSPVADVGQAPANFYDVQDLHGLIWEWVGDFASLLVIDDSRDPSDKTSLQFCGSGALNLRDLENFAVLMRVAMLTSLQADNSTSNLGFRCARSLPEPEPLRNPS